MEKSDALGITKALLRRGIGESHEMRPCPRQVGDHGGLRKGDARQTVDMDRTTNPAETDLLESHEVGGCPPKQLPQRLVLAIHHLTASRAPPP